MSIGIHLDDEPPPDSEGCVTLRAPKPPRKPRKKDPDTFTFNLPVVVSGESRDVRAGFYGREVARLATPILCRLHGVDPRSADSTLELQMAACRLHQGHFIRVTMRVCRDGTLKLVRATQPRRVKP